MLREPSCSDSSSNDHDDLSKDELKKQASSVNDAHILSVRSKCKILNGKEGFDQKIESCLQALDKVEETSLILQALKFSDYVTICLDPNKSDLSIIKSKAIGWFNYLEGEVMIASKELENDKPYFLGVLAHELAHWCMQVVFKNTCLPYYQSDPNRQRQIEFGTIVDSVGRIYGKGANLESVISSVFKDYDESHWHQELIVRVPHLIAWYGVDKSTEILCRHQPTEDLLNFYRKYVLPELRKFVAEGDLEKCRESVVKLNRKLGLLDLYQKYEMKFTAAVDINFQDGTSIWVISSPHPYMTFLKIAWSMNCDETTDRFYGNNLFCDFEGFANNYEEIWATFIELRECKTLFIACPQTVNEISLKYLFKYLERASKLEYEKKIIMTISKKLLSQAKTLLSGVSVVGKCISIDKIEFNDIEESSKELVLNSSVIVHQGHEVELGTLMEQEGYDIYDGVFIERLIHTGRSNGRIVVGETQSSVRDCSAEFVPLNEQIDAERLVKMVQDCNKSLDYVLILVGELGNYPEQLEKFICDVFKCDDLNQISIKSSDSLLDRLSQNPPISPILLIDSDEKAKYYPLVSHFLKTLKSKLCYFIDVKKKSISCNLMYYPDLNFNRKLNNDLLRNGKGVDQVDFMKNVMFGNERFNIITDKAGTGKTKFLNMIYSSITDCWAIKCSWKSCLPFIDEYELGKNMDREEAVDFITKMGNLNDPFAKDLLDVKMTRNSQFPVVLLLDGVDEVGNSYQNDATVNRNKIINLIEFLEEQTSVRAVITTRPEAKTSLAHLSCLFTEFSPISLKESKSYLVKLTLARRRLFTNPGDNLSSTEVKQLVGKYIGRHQVDSHVSHSFLETPLHISMLSDIIVRSMKNRTSYTPIVDSQGRLMVDRLYKEFIDDKYKIYYHEKKDTAVDKRLVNSTSFNSALQLLSVFSMDFRENINPEYYKKSELFLHKEKGKVIINREEAAQYLDLGIISSIQDDKVEFVHLTFAEYFISCFYLGWATDESMFGDWVEEVICKPHRVTSFLESMMNNLELSHDVYKEHGELMASKDIVKTVYSLRIYMMLDRVNFIDYIYKCWKCAGKFHIILNPENYKRNSDYPPFLAANLCSERLLELVLQEDFKLDIGNSNEESLALIRRAKVTTMKRLLESGRLKGGSLLLINAVANEDIELVEQLVGVGYEIDTNSMKEVVGEGKLEMAQWLKKSGWSIEQRINDRGDTLMHLAVRNRQFPAIKWLVDEGLDINKGDYSNKTPLHLAIVMGDLKMVRFLVDAGADIRVRTKIGWNVLHYAVTSPITRIDLIKWLVAQGFEVDDVTPRGCSAIHLALKYSGSTDVLEWMLDKTKRKEARDSEGYGYLHYAAQNKGGFHFFLLVLSKNSNVSLRGGTQGKTAAHVAIDTILALELYDSEDEDRYEEYLSKFNNPLKQLISQMANTNPLILEELVLYAKETAVNKTNLLLESVIEWMEMETSKRLPRSNDSNL